MDHHTGILIFTPSYTWSTRIMFAWFHSHTWISPRWPTRMTKKWNFSLFFYFWFYPSKDSSGRFPLLIISYRFRELNELRKPVSDNPDILRFFKYMKAAKDGQDGVECDLAYQDCSSYNDMVNPAMVNTFNDINKLVHARKIL